MKKAEVKPDEELANAVETLGQITNEWLEQQRNRFENTTSTFRKKRISDCYIINRFKNTMCKKLGPEDIFVILRIFTLKIIGSFTKAGKYIIVCSIEFIIKIERH